MDKEKRPLTIDDYEDIIAVWNASGLPTKPNGRDSRAMMATEMAREFCTYLGILVDGKLVGVVICNFDGRHGWINRLAVDPGYQRMGLAGELIEAARVWFARFGDELVISALIEEDNTPSRECFARNGFHFHETITYWSKRPRPDL